ncbi:MAG: GxxExxY protein [Planctomycetota bacterium]
MEDKGKEFKHKALTEKIIGAALTVFKTLGSGFVEKVYENALKRELEDLGLRVEQQKNLRVYYKGDVVGDFFADLVVENAVIVELKATETWNEIFEVQLVNYLKSSEYEVGLILNFGRRLDFKRKVSTKPKSR